MEVGKKEFSKHGDKNLQNDDNNNTNYKTFFFPARLLLYKFSIRHLRFSQKKKKIIIIAGEVIIIIIKSN